MDTCVRSSCYEDALALYGYVQQLSKRHGNTIPLIAVRFTAIKIYICPLIHIWAVESSVARAMNNCSTIASAPLWET